MIFGGSGFIIHYHPQFMTVILPQLVTKIIIFLLVEMKEEDFFVYDKMVEDFVGEAYVQSY